MRSAIAGLTRKFRRTADHELKHLSRGMRMKAALASSLAYRPEVVVLDEPFTGLDPPTWRRATRAGILFLRYDPRACIRRSLEATGVRPVFRAGVGRVLRALTPFKIRHGEPKFAAAR